MKAVKSGNLGIVKLLLAHGANTNDKDWQKHGINRGD
jgi:ankyrin repeat protein